MLVKNGGIPLCYPRRRTKTVKKKIPCRQQGTILINMITTVDLLIYILGTVRASPNLQGLWVKYVPGKYTQQADIKRKERLVSHVLQREELGDNSMKHNLIRWLTRSNSSILCGPELLSLCVNNWPSSNSRPILFPFWK